MRFSLSKDDTKICKAIAMLMIVCHNYFHLLPNRPGENEFSFHWSRFFEVWIQIAETPLDMFRPIASFFGHYGVHIFIFLSGYGLTKKALKVFDGLNEVSKSALYTLVLGQIFKLWKLMVLGGVFTVAVWWISLPDPDWGKRFSEFLWTLSFTNAVVPGHRYYFVSVWWFLSLIVQCYLIFPLLYSCVTADKKVAYFIGGTVMLGVLLYSPMRHAGVSVYGTVLGHLPIFALGVWLAKGGELKKSRKIMLGLAILLVAGWTLRPFFHFSFLLVTLMFVYCYESMRSFLNCRFLQYIGALSTFIYITHGELRWPIIKYLSTLDQPCRLIEYLGFVFYFALVIISAVILKWFSGKIRLFESSKRITTI